MQEPTRIGELLVALFLLGTVLLAPPVLTVFNKATRIFGLPVLFLYLFVVWTVLIALLALVVARRRSRGEPAEAGTDIPGRQPEQAPGGPGDA